MDLKCKVSLVSSKISEVNLPSLINLLDLESCDVTLVGEDGTTSIEQIVGHTLHDYENEMSYIQTQEGYSKPLDLSSLIVVEIYQDEEQNIMIKYKRKEEEQ